MCILYSWAFYTSLSHASTFQDSDPALTQAVVARLLGNTNGPSDAVDTATTPAAMVSSIPNPVLKFLNSREAPKALTIKSEDAHSRNNTNIDLRKMHHAGGYDFSSYEMRNWSEIHMHIGQL